jgi:hypothetical protein
MMHFRTVYGTKSGHNEIRRVNINAAPLDREGYAVVKETGGRLIEEELAKLPDSDIKQRLVRRLGENMEGISRDRYCL